MSRRSLFFLVPILASLCGAATAGAQNFTARADSLLRAGRLDAAEALYYGAVRQRPRDPEARLALGRYLAARGRLRVGAVLMEEARFFGGDARLVATQLAPVYARLGDWRALASLPGSPLPYAERARAEYLRENPPAATVGSSARLGYRPDERGPLGSVQIVIGGRTIEARIDPTVHELVLDTAWLARDDDVRRFAESFDAQFRNFTGVVNRAQLGEIELTNVPARFEAIAGGGARIGLALLARWSPTFDPSSRTISLREGRLPRDPDARRIPLLMGVDNIFLIQPGGLQSLGQAATLAGRRWTLDGVRGEAVLGDEGTAARDD